MKLSHFRSTFHGHPNHSTTTFGDEVWCHHWGATWILKYYLKQLRFQTVNGILFKFHTRSDFRSNYINFICKFYYFWTLKVRQMERHELHMKYFNFLKMMHNNETRYRHSKSDYHIDIHNNGLGVSAYTQYNIFHIMINGK